MRNAEFGMRIAEWEKSSCLLSKALSLWPRLPLRTLRSLWLIFVFLVFISLLTACAPKKITHPPYEPGKEIRYRETGIASWYGEDFHGRKTANGEVYDMHAMTAAHRTLPFNIRVRVTNLDNGQKTEVRVNDRGPFIPGRIIDLSRSGAKELGMLGPGTARVLVEATGFYPGAAQAMEGTYAIQVGAFLEKENAYRFREELARRHPKVQVVLYETHTKRFYRVRLGAFRTEDQARRYYENLRKENLIGFIVRED
jgi:rare lipoprotein A